MMKIANNVFGECQTIGQFVTRINDNDKLSTDATSEELAAAYAQSAVSKAGLRVTGENIETELDCLIDLVEFSAKFDFQKTLAMAEK